MTGQTVQSKYLVFKARMTNKDTQQATYDEFVENKELIIRNKLRLAYSGPRYAGIDLVSIFKDDFKTFILSCLNEDENNEKDINFKKWSNQIIEKYAIAIKRKVHKVLKAFAISLLEKGGSSNWIKCWAILQNECCSTIEKVINNCFHDEKYNVVRAKLKETVVSNYSSYILKEGLYKQKEGNVANPPNPVIIKDNLQGWLYKSLAHFVCNEKYRRFIDEELGVPVIDKVRLDNTPPKKGLDDAYDNDDDIDGSQDESNILDFEATDTEDKGINPRTQMRRWLKLCSDETQIILNLKFFEEYDEQRAADELNIPLEEYKQKERRALAELYFVVVRSDRRCFARSKSLYNKYHYIKPHLNTSELEASIKKYDIERGNVIYHSISEIDDNIFKDFLSGKSLDDMLIKYSKNKKNKIDKEDPISMALRIYDVFEYLNILDEEAVVAIIYEKGVVDGRLAYVTNEEGTDYLK